MKAYVKELKTALRAAKKAGTYLKTRFNKKHTVHQKEVREEATEADVGAENIILKELQKAFPKYSVLAEEKGKIAGNEFTWVIDPLDGTTNYTLKSPFFDTAIALAKNNEIVLSVVLVPFTGEVFHAVKGQGAFVNGKKMQVSSTTLLKETHMHYCHSTQPKELTRNMKMYHALKAKVYQLSQYKAANIEMSYCAAGRLDAFIDNGASAWDVSCGALMVKEAGGNVTDFKGKPWNLSSKDIFASNGKMHKTLLQYLKKV
jgi:myo-inositol-1(or 4)-monophosphatase